MVRIFYNEVIYAFIVQGAVLMSKTKKMRLPDPWVMRGLCMVLFG